MRIRSGVISGASRLARIQELSREATRRLKWFDTTVPFVVIMAAAVPH
jgi:hypothetical protein